MNYDNFIKERNSALLSLERKKIEKYCRKYGVPIPPSDLAFWMGVHKAICGLKGITEEQRQRSVNWLREHGSKPEFIMGGY